MMMPLNVYQYANRWAGRPLDAPCSAVEAAQAARDMDAAGWTPVGYDDWGEQIFVRSCPHCGVTPLLEVPGSSDPRDSECAQCGQLTWDGS